MPDMEPSPEGIPAKCWVQPAALGVPTEFKGGEPQKQLSSQDEPGRNLASTPMTLERLPDAELAKLRLEQPKEQLIYTSTLVDSPLVEKPCNEDLSDQGYFSRPNDSPPPRPDEIDRWQCHIGLQQFGRDLQHAANAAFPNTAASRYKNIYVLMLKWQDEDPNLPVSHEISKLFHVFESVFGFETEVWSIPDEDCHAEVNQKILDFSRLGGNQRSDLKIVYYAGHGKLTRNRLLSWTSWRNNQKLKCPTVKWSGIQNVPEESQSDVLILLDCCNAGTANTNEGEGVTELISACAYNTKANGVGPYSFTHALVIELQDLAKRPNFTVGELYSNIFCRIQARMPEDGTERHAAPVHLVLTNDSRYRRSIHLSKRPNLKQGNSSMAPPGSNLDEGLGEDSNPILFSDADSQNSSRFLAANAPGYSSPRPKLPRIALAIRLKEDFKMEELSPDLFAEWLRTIPTIATQVKVEAGFDSFSSLVVISIPISLYGYLRLDPAVISLGPITSSNLLNSPGEIRGRPSITSPTHTDHECDVEQQVESFHEQSKFNPPSERRTDPLLQINRDLEAPLARPLTPELGSPFIKPQPRARSPSVEVLKSFPTYKAILAALKKYNIIAPWNQFTLSIVWGNAERLLEMDEKPLIIYSQLKKQGNKPMFMLRKKLEVMGNVDENREKQENIVK